MATNIQLLNQARDILSNLQTLYNNMLTARMTTAPNELPPTIKAPDGTEYDWNDLYDKLPKMIENAQKQFEYWNRVTAAERRTKRSIRGLNIEI